MSVKLGPTIFALMCMARHAVVLLQAKPLLAASQSWPLVWLSTAVADCGGNRAKACHRFAFRTHGVGTFLLTYGNRF
jgi:hypothetical protein